MPVSLPLTLSARKILTSTVEIRTAFEIGVFESIKQLVCIGWLRFTLIDGEEIQSADTIGVGFPRVASMAMVKRQNKSCAVRYLYLLWLMTTVTAGQCPFSSCPKRSGVRWR